jgi:MFS family permease
MGASALIPADVARNRPFAAACMTTLMLSAVFFATVLYVPQFMEKVLDFSPLESGVGMLPMMAIFALMAFAAGPIYQRLGAKPVVASGCACLVLGPLLLSLVDSGSDYSSLVPGLAITGLGVGLFYPSITTAAVTALDEARASLAGGLVYMFQIAGGAIGLGLTTAVFTEVAEANNSFSAGLETSFRMVAGIALASLVISLLFVEGKREES